MIASSNKCVTKRILLSYFEKSRPMPVTINQNRAPDQPKWDTTENYSMILMQAAFYK